MSPLYFCNSYRNGYRHLFWIVLALATLFACSGGESGTGYQDNQTTVGEVTGFGSIYVNGIHFNTDQVSIEIDDDTTAVETDLRVGMVVKVVGTVNADRTQGVANQVIMSTGIEGLVFSNNYLVDGTINVMGQTVNINNDTHFNSNVVGIDTFEQLVANDTVVEVHGFTDGQGEFFATMIEVVEIGGTATEVKLRGVIQSLTGTTAGNTFTLGGITIQFDGATIFEDGLLMADLMNGLYVEVESAFYSGTGAVLATEIEPANQSESEGTGYELEGIVTDIANIGSNEFSLNGQRVVFNLMTMFEGGVSADIQLESELEVEGVFQADGSILAHEISFHMESDMEVEGAATVVNGNTLSIFDTNSSTTVTVVVNQLTSYEDEVDEMNHTFNFGDITDGMNIHVKYYTDTNMVNIATSIERRNP